MSRYKAILFDYGNVLCMPQLESDVVAMAECLKIELNRFKTLYWQHRDEYDVGTYDGRRYWTMIAEHAGAPIDDAQLAKVIEYDNVGWSRPNQVMANWAKKLKESGLITAIISNMPQDIREYLRHLPWMPEFTHYTYSCEVNSVKPSADIYLHCLEQLQIRPVDALFLDDRQMNVDAAQQLGIDAHVFTTAEALQPFVVKSNLPELSLNAVV